MRITSILPFAFLSLTLVACSGVDIQQTGIGAFTAGNHHFYKWRTDPLPSSSRSSDPVYAIDPLLRKAVDTDLQSKGYALDEERADFTVDYLYLSGMQQGERSELASNVSPYPRVTPNRNASQASIDNAIALGGVKETNNIILQFNDPASNQQIWQVTLTEIVEDANNADATRLDDNLQELLQHALKPLPPASLNRQP